MPRYGSISLVAFEDRDPDKVFVKVPNERGRWMRTDLCVIAVECPQCNAHKGEPCKHNGKYWVGTHYVRRRAAHHVSYHKTPEERREMQIRYLDEADFSDG